MFHRIVVVTEAFPRAVRAFLLQSIAAATATLSIIIGLLTLCSDAARAASDERQLSGSWNLTVSSNGPVKIRVFSAGEGPTIVMLPGRSRGPAALEPLGLILVKSGFRIVLPEPRGYGESTGPLDNVSLRDLSNDVARAIESTSKSPVVLAGHAFGNRIARLLASDRPDLIRATVLMAAGGKFPPTPEAGRNLRLYFDKSQAAATRMQAARAALFGPKSDPKQEDYLLDMISDGANKAQTSAAN
jgi:pimeloyl-ACP methyl ester carboxylesterase